MSSQFQYRQFLFAENLEEKLNFSQKTQINLKSTKELLSSIFHLNFVLKSKNFNSNKASKLSNYRTLYKENQNHCYLYQAQMK